MAHVEVRDHVIWAKHVHGDAALKERLIGMQAGDLIELKVNAFRGMWTKMDDGSQGLPTPGIKPIGRAREEWHKLQARRGDLVTFEVV